MLVSARAQREREGGGQARGFMAHSLNYGSPSPPVKLFAIVFRATGLVRCSHDPLECAKAVGLLEVGFERVDRFADWLGLGSLSNIRQNTCKTRFSSNTK
jgi:hypothetical protein